MNKLGIALVLGLLGIGCSSSGTTSNSSTGDARGAFTGSSGTACACPNGKTDCLLTCPDGTDGTCSSGKPSCSGKPADAGPPTDAGTSNLKWYVTCGDPVCGNPNAPACVADSASCPAVGSACTTKGQTCNDCTQGCGAKVVCDDHDPTTAPGGCPISSRKFKDNIGYLQGSDLERLHDETMRMRLATYNYKDMYGNPYETHLGFIIEDQPQSMSVDRGHDRVDLYGYLSMTVAALQVQEQKIQDLEKRVASCESQKKK